MYAVPAAHGPISAATCGTTPLMITSSRKRWPEPGEQRARPPPGSARRPSRAARSSGMRFVSAISRRRVTFISPVMPIEPAMTVKS